MSFVLKCLDNQNDLINLSQTCKKFCKFVSQELYSKLVIVDKYEGNSKLTGVRDFHGYTVLNMKNYPKFLATLHTNEAQIQLIKHIVIATNTAVLVTDHENVYQPLYDIFMTKDNNLKSFRNYDLNNLKKFGSILNYNKNHLIKFNFQKYNFTNLIEDEDDGHEGVNVDALIEKDLLNLKNSAILDFKELRVLPKSVEELQILIENQYTLNKDEFHMTARIFNKFTNLKTLHLSNTLTLGKFTEEMLKHTDKPWFRRLQLETLSISNLHKSYMLPPVTFEQLNKIINIPNVINFEIKMNCLAKNVCQHCIINFFSDWSSELSNLPTSSKLKKLSIIEVQSPLSGEASLINNQWTELFLNHNDRLRVIFYTVESLVLSLDDYPLLPCLSSPALSNIPRKVTISNEIIKTRNRIYRRLMASLNDEVIKDLDIPDFLINWLPYVSTNTVETWFDKDGVCRYFDSNDCSSCHETLKRYDLQNPQDRQNFNELILKEMFSRVRNVTLLTSTLNPLSRLCAERTCDRPSLRFNDQDIDQEDFEALQKCVFHSLFNKKCLSKLTGLETINFGGIGKQKFIKLTGKKTVLKSVDWKVEEIRTV